MCIVLQKKDQCRASERLQYENLKREIMKFQISQPLDYVLVGWSHSSEKLKTAFQNHTAIEI